MEDVVSIQKNYSVMIVQMNVFLISYKYNQVELNQKAIYVLQDVKLMYRSQTGLLLQVFQDQHQ